MIHHDGLAGTINALETQIRSHSPQDSEPNRVTMAVEVPRESSKLQSLACPDTHCRLLLKTAGTTF